MKQQSDLLIIGGGLNGPVLALAAAQTGLSTTVVDARDEADLRSDTFDGRAYALALASIRMLTRLEIWDNVADHAQEMREIKVSDSKVGRPNAVLGLHFDSAEIEEGAMGHMLEDRYLRRALLDAMAAEPNITLLTDQRAVAQTVAATGVTVDLKGGQTLTGRLLIGADGRGSQVAERADIRRMEWSYDQTAIVCALEHAHPHNGIAHQLFLPAGPLGILPLPGNRSSIVWAEDTALASDIIQMNDADFLNVLRPRFGDFLGEIALTGARFTYPLGLSLANAFVADRLALIGDAAHGVHPLAGQGLNAGLRDVAALTHVLTHAQRRGEDIAAPGVLARYQSWRRFDITSLAGATDMFNRLFSNDTPLLRMGRDLGMKAINAVPSLRRSFIREAAGLTGDLPDLMR